MHLVDNSVGVNSTTAIVASSIPNAVGYAYAAKLKNTGQVVVSFFGDGATEEGVAWESLNFAALHRLPILFVCENNDLAIHTKQHQRQAHPVICDRAKANGVEAINIVGSDPWEVYETAKRTITKIRHGAGPRFIEAQVSRWLEHVGPNEDWSLGYRSREESSIWKENDGVELAGRRLNVGTREKIDAEIQKQIEDAVKFAEQSEFPSSEELLNYVYR